MRADFVTDGVVRFAVAYGATLHVKQTRAVDVIAIEAHDTDTHIIGHRQIHQHNGKPMLGALGPIESAGRSRYATLLAA